MTRLILRALALGSTLWVLVATSNPNPLPCSGKPVEQQIFRVEGNCGAEGAISIESNSVCALTVDGGPSAFLPQYGEQSGPGSMLDGGVTLKLWGSVAGIDGRRPPFVDGGARPTGCSTPGCRAADLYRDCVGGAQNGVIVLDCQTTAPNELAESCQAILVPFP